MCVCVCVCVCVCERDYVLLNNRKQHSTLGKQLKKFLQTKMTPCSIPAVETLPRKTGLP